MLRHLSLSQCIFVFRRRTWFSTPFHIFDAYLTLSFLITAIFSLFSPLTFNTFLSFSLTTFENRYFSFFLWVCHRHRVTCLSFRREIIVPTSKLGCIYRYETQPTFAPTMEQTSNQLLTKDSRHRSLAIGVCKVSLYIYLHKDR